MIVAAWQSRRAYISKIVATAANDGFLIKALAIGAGALALTVGGFGVATSIQNANRITRLEAQLEIAETIEDGFQRLERAIRETR